MGQYYKGRKIGTCERMYYMRQDECEKLAEQGRADDDGVKFSEYLSDNITAFRFPFPNEDKLTPNELADKAHARAFSIPIGNKQINHTTICVSNSPKGTSGHNVNIFLPCIHSQEFKNTGIKLSNGGAGEQFIDILYTGNRYKDDATTGKMTRKTIFACSRCGQEQRASDDDIAKMKERAREYYAYLDQTGKNNPNESDQARYDEIMTTIDRIS